MAAMLCSSSCSRRNC